MKSQMISGGASPQSLGSFRQGLITLPWNLAISLFRLLYGFRVEGAENIPREGPYILVLNEHSLIATFVSGWMSIGVLLQALRSGNGTNTISYMQEDVFAVPYIRKVLNARSPGYYAPLLPHSAGHMALSLLEGHRVLQAGGVVVLNPEGDMPWDGRPLPIGLALAWLGLHSSAPLVLALCSTGAYDIWPRWQSGPSLRGRLLLQVGQPFKLCDVPQQRVTDEDLARANAQIAAELSRLRYGQGGIGEWAGPPKRNDALVEPPSQLTPGAVAGNDRQPAGKRPAALWGRGIPLVLWRCPVCQTNDSLFHKRPLFRSPTLWCQACDTHWEIRRVIGQDFRLRVLKGPQDLIDLDMALSHWYDEMKRGFTPSPISVSGADLLPDECVYLEASRIPLLPHRPSALFDGWTGREPPQAQPPGLQRLADWGSIGEGRLLLTSHRLLWQGPQGELDFKWSSVRAVFLWRINTLGIRYGAVPYRFALGQETGLKWLTYAGAVTQKVAAECGSKITLSCF